MLVLILLVRDAYSQITASPGTIPGKGQRVVAEFLSPAPCRLASRATDQLFPSAPSLPEVGFWPRLLRRVPLRAAEHAGL